MSEDKSNLLKRRQPIEISSIDPNYTPRIRVPIIPRTPPPYTTIAAVVLLFFGIFFLTFGLVVFYTHLWTHGKDRAIALIVLGSIMFIPGSYSSYILYGTWRGWDGYSYEQVPSYDD